MSRKSTLVSLSEDYDLSPIELNRLKNVSDMAAYVYVMLLRYRDRHIYMPMISEIAEAIGHSSNKAALGYLFELECEQLIRRDWKRERVITTPFVMGASW